MRLAFPFETRDGRSALVRPARPRDARAVLSVTGAIARERPRTLTVTEQELWGPREWKRQLVQWGPNGVTLVAKVERRIVGSLSCSRSPRQALRHVAQFGVTVSGPYRGIGVGRTLLEVLERWAEEVGVGRIELGVFPGNERARSLYERMGYEVEGVQRRAVRFPDGDEDIVLMAKLLDPMRRYH